MTWKRALLLIGAALLLRLVPWRRLLREFARPEQGGPAQPLVGHAELAGLASLPASPLQPKPTLSVAPVWQAPQAQEDAPSAPLPLARPAPEDAFSGMLMTELPDDVQTAATLEVDIKEEELYVPVPADEASVEELPSDTIEESNEAPVAEILTDASEDVGDVSMVDTHADEPEELAEAPAAEFEASAVAPDDLLCIEGIGPRISTVVTAAGITSFADLVSTDVEQLKTLLVNAGFKTVDPSTWPEQARIAAEGHWDDLRALQARIKNGRLS